MPQALQDLAQAGVAVWLDDLSRPRLQSGRLARMVAQGEVVGITTNPTIFAKAIGAGSGYEGQLRELALRGTAIGATLRLLTAWDVRAACDVLQPVYGRTGGCPSRWTRASPATPNARRRRRAACGGWWTGPTCSSRSRRRWPGCPRSPRRWPTASASTSRWSSRWSATRRCWTPTSPGWSGGWRLEATCWASRAWRRSSSAGWTPRLTGGLPTSRRVATGRTPRQTRPACTARPPSPMPAGLPSL
jgi:hypothetical protein